MPILKLLEIQIQVKEPLLFIDKAFCSELPIEILSLAFRESMPFNQSADKFFIFRNPVSGIKVGFSLVEVVVVTGLVLLVSLVAFQTAEVVGQR